MNAVLRHLRRAGLAHAGAGPDDALLLDRFVAARDGEAFAALLHRHGPMVLAVCRRVLGDAHDAEDAFQATFLVLARKAPALHACRSLGGWLHGVAYRTALKARGTLMRRRARERTAGRRAADVAPDEPPHELLRLLDQELARLPEHYRVPVVLCELEGRSRKDAAAQLRIPEGTLSSRLAYARKLLAARLTRRGAGWTTAAVAAVLGAGTAPAGVPANLLGATARAALACTGTGAVQAGAVSARVGTLTDEVIKAMFLSKLKAFGLVTFFLVVGVGLTALGYRPAGAQSERPREPARSRQTADALEELRLEVAALRKGLEVMRDRVRTLEVEVQTLHTTRPMSGGLGGGGLGGGLSGVGGLGGFSGGATLQGTSAALGGTPTSTTFPPAQAFRPKQPVDPLERAEAALRRLRANPGDTQAADQLERALKELKTHATPPKGKDPAK